MDSQTIVEKYQAKLSGQQMLFADHDYILRQTSFKSIDPSFDKESIVHFWMNVYVSNSITYVRKHHWYKK